MEKNCMNFKTSKKIFLNFLKSVFVFISVLMISSCDFINSKVTSITVKCPGAPSRSAKEIIENIAYYQITLKALDGQSVYTDSNSDEETQTGTPGSTITFSSINPGNYNVTLAALDIFKYEISSVSEAVEVKEGQNTNVPLTLKIGDKILELQEGLLGSLTNPAKDFIQLKTVVEGIKSVAIPTKVYYSSEINYDNSEVSENIIITGNVIIASPDGELSGPDTIVIYNPNPVNENTPVITIEQYGLLTLENFEISEHASSDFTGILIKPDAKLIGSKLKLHADISSSGNSYFSDTAFYNEFILSGDSKTVIKNSENFYPLDGGYIQKVSLNENSYLEMDNTSISEIQASGNSTIYATTSHPDFVSLSDSANLKLDKSIYIGSVLISSPETTITLKENFVFEEEALILEFENYPENFEANQHPLYNYSDFIVTNETDKNLNQLFTIRNIEVPVAGITKNFDYHFSTDGKIKKSISSYNELLSEINTANLSTEATKEKPYEIYLSYVNPVGSSEDEYKGTQNLEIKTSVKLTSVEHATLTRPASITDIKDTDGNTIPFIAVNENANLEISNLTITTSSLSNSQNEFIGNVSSTDKSKTASIKLDSVVFEKIAGPIYKSNTGNVTAIFNDIHINDSRDNRTGFFYNNSKDSYFELTDFSMYDSNPTYTIYNEIPVDIYLGGNFSSMSSEAGKAGEFTIYSKTNYASNIKQIHRLSTITVDYNQKIYIADSSDELRIKQSLPLISPDDDADEFKIPANQIFEFRDNPFVIATDNTVIYKLTSASFKLQPSVYNYGFGENLELKEPLEFETSAAYFFTSIKNPEDKAFSIFTSVLPFIKTTESGVTIDASNNPVNISLAVTSFEAEAVMIADEGPLTLSGVTFSSLPLTAVSASNIVSLDNCTIQGDQTGVLIKELGYLVLSGNTNLNGIKISYAGAEVITLENDFEPEKDITNPSNITPIQLYLSDDICSSYIESNQKMILNSSNYDLSNIFKIAGNPGFTYKINSEGYLELAN